MYKLFYGLRCDNKSYRKKMPSKSIKSVENSSKQ